MPDSAEGRATIREVYNLVGDVEQRLLDRIDKLEETLRQDQRTEISRLEARIKTDEKIGWIGSILAAIAAAAITLHGLVSK